MPEPGIHDDLIHVVLAAYPPGFTNLRATIQLADCQILVAIFVTKRERRR